MTYGTGQEAEVRAEIARHPEFDATLRLLARDMESTLGWPADRAWGFVLQTATVSLEFVDDLEWPFDERVIENVQQRMHDEFVDTAWPACPVHRTHPLWMPEARPWRWECGDLSIPLGQLDPSGPRPNAQP